MPLRLPMRLNAAWIEACSVCFTCIEIIAVPAGPEIAPRNVPRTVPIMVPPHFAMKSSVPQSPLPQRVPVQQW